MSGNMLDPLKPPAPVGYGYTGPGNLQAPFSAQHAYNHGAVPQFQAPMQPDQVSRELSQGQTPDVLKIVNGAGDRSIVGELLNLSEGKPSSLRGVSAQLAKDMLGRWGYPDSADAWSYDQWAKAIQSRQQLAQGPQVGY